MTFILFVAALVLLLYLLSQVGAWLYDADSTPAWQYPQTGSYERMLEEVAIQRERQKDAIAAAQVARQYAQQMKYHRQAGQAQMAEISSAYVRKVQEVIRR